MSGVDYRSSPRYQEDITVADDLTIGDDVEILGDLSVSGNATLGNLSAGVTYFLESIDGISGGMTVNGAGLINNTLTVTGDTNISGGLTANGATTINDDFIVTGDVSISGGLLLSGNLGISSGGITIPTTSVLSATNVEEEFLPIDWAEDGASPPAASTTLISGSGTVQIREFDSTNVEDVIFPWEVPRDIVISDGIKFQVIGYIVTSTAPAAGEGVSFKMSGYSIGDSDSLDGTFGTEIESNYTDLNGHAGGDRFATTLSTKVTVTDLAVGETAMLHLERDTADADDDYGQDVGVVGVKLIYTKQLGA